MGGNRSSFKFVGSLNIMCVTVNKPKHSPYTELLNGLDINFKK